MTRTCTATNEHFDIYSYNLSNDDHITLPCPVLINGRDEAMLNIDVVCDHTGTLKSLVMAKLKKPVLAIPLGEYAHFDDIRDIIEALPLRANFTRVLREPTRANIVTFDKVWGAKV